MIKFGIVIPTYQRPDGKTPFYLKRALESIKNQTYQNFKIFLIGDKYDNNDEFMSFSEEIENNKIYIENLPSAYEREKYINNKGILWTCGGIYASNYGIDIALKEGYDYICRLDHDDFWNSTHLENFKNLIDLHNPDFMCSKSIHFNRRTLPDIQNKDKYIKFLPGPSGLIKSSTCINQKSIPLRIRNVFEETGRAYPGDADLWTRLRKYIEENDLISYCVNETTCNHLEEGYSKSMK
jgi:glycosyltransferase involved in cell wall biosynthesis